MDVLRGSLVGVAVVAIAIGLFGGFGVLPLATAVTSPTCSSGVLISQSFTTTVIDNDSLSLHDHSCTASGAYVDSGVAWGDGMNSSIALQGSVFHVYQHAGTYVISEEIVVWQKVCIAFCFNLPVPHYSNATVTAPFAVNQTNKTSPSLTPSFSTAFSHQTGFFNDTTTASGGDSIASVAWTFGDGGTGTGSKVSHTYPEKNESYNVTETVTDVHGRTFTATTVVTITASGAGLNVYLSAPTPTVFTWSATVGALLGAGIFLLIGAFVLMEQPWWLGVLVAAGAGGGAFIGFLLR
jgi:PKD domain